MTGVDEHTDRAADVDTPLTLYLVKQLELVARALMDDALRPHGLTTLQYTALTVLASHSELSSAQLARRSFVTPQSMHEMVRWLEHRGLVERRRDEANRRVLLIGLTDAGRAALSACDPIIRSLEQRILEAMNPGERAVFRECLHRSYAALAPLAKQHPGPPEESTEVP